MGKDIKRQITKYKGLHHTHKLTLDVQPNIPLYSWNGGNILNHCSNPNKYKCNKENDPYIDYRTTKKFLNGKKKNHAQSKKNA